MASKVPSPVYHDGKLYWIDNRGVADCVQADSGKKVAEVKLTVGGGSGNKVYASLLLADGKFYCVTRKGGVIVLAAGPEFKELARNDLGDTSVFNAAPVPCNGRLLLRSDRSLYCLGK